MKTFAQKVIDYNTTLSFNGKLPPSFKVVNPFRENPAVLPIMEKFYRKYYSDTEDRKLMLGINPGRLGAGTTGVPFTDTKRLEQECGIEMPEIHTHEVSAMFIYEMIAAYGGVEDFYKNFYINSAFPLAIVREKNGRWLNANYYDDKELFQAVKPFMKETIRAHIELGIDTSEVFSFGKKNAEFLNRLNDEEHFFDKITALEHPRYIQQYKTKDKKWYIDKFILALKK